MSLFVIRHKPTGAFFPMLKGGSRRGSTYIALPFIGSPRIFSNEIAARNCLRWWLAGEAAPKYGTDDWAGYDTKVGASPGKGDANRKAHDMEIVEVELKLVGQLELI